MRKEFLIAGGILAFLGVAIGAFGAHGLKETLLVNNRIETFDTGVKYHMYHALGLLLINGVAFYKKSRPVNIASILFIAGIVLFSGSLYTLSITNQLFLGAITPVGGICFLLGWAFFVYAVIKNA